MIARWSEGIADANMAEDILVKLRALVERHPWWWARTRLTLELLGQLGVRPPARVLDVGCGWGITLDALEHQGYRAVGADISRRALESIDRPGRELAEFDLTKALPAEVGSFDAVLALDVIEHLDDDRDAVGRLGALVEPGGVAVVSVPALPDFFTEFDEVQGHRRRYLPETLRSAFRGSGLEVERVFWWGSWMVPMLRLQRGRARPGKVAGESADDVYRHYLKTPPWPAPLLFKAAFEMERGRALAGKLSTGTSLFAVARRPAAAG